MPALTSSAGKRSPVAEVAQLLCLMEATKCSAASEEDGASLQEAGPGTGQRVMNGWSERSQAAPQPGLGSGAKT